MLAAIFESMVNELYCCKDSFYQEIFSTVDQISVESFHRFTLQGYLGRLSQMDRLAIILDSLAIRSTGQFFGFCIDVCPHL